MRNLAIRSQLIRTDKNGEDATTRTIDLDKLDAFIERNGKRLVAGIVLVYAAVKALDTASSIALIKTDSRVVVVQAPPDESSGR